MHTCRVTADGHLIDSGLMSRFLGAIIEGGGSYEIARFDIGRTKRDFSHLELEVRAGREPLLTSIVDNLLALGCRRKDVAPVQLERAPKDGVAPDAFYATTHHRTEVFHGGRWLCVEKQRMDGMIVVRGATARCTLMRDLARGDLVVCGSAGVATYPPFETRKAEHFSFMKSENSSERAVEVKGREVAELIREVKRSGRRVVAVPGPVVVHTGAAPALARLIARGWIDAILSGNALAVHDAELALYGTSLGVDVEDGVAVREGHMHHLRAINAVRRAGSLAAAVRRGVLKRGIFRECVRRGVPFALAGSIRDDGPLPDTEMNLLRAQERYAELLQGAGLVLVLASMLHGIGVGNMSASDVTIVCVDIHGSVVTKLADRGSAHAIGIVTDVSAFLRCVDENLNGRAPKAGRKPRR